MTPSRENEPPPQTQPTSIQNPSESTHSAHVQQEVVMGRIEYSFSGPLPPARELEAYERALLGSAERIFRMREAEIALTEAQVKNRLGLENKVIDSDIRNSRIGVVCANIWLFAGLGMTTLFVMTGHDTAGEIIGPSVIGSILAAFLSNNLNRRKERTDKMKLLTGDRERDTNEVGNDGN